MINKILRKYFGIGILVSIGLAFLFPYTAIQLQPAATAFLFLLMFVIGLNVEWVKLKEFFRRPKELILGNVLIFIAMPLIVFILAKILLTTEQYIYGIVFAALTPTAIVAPFFTNLLSGDKNLSFGILVSSMLISPFIIPPALSLLVGDILPNATLLLFKDMLLLITVPILLSVLVKIYFRKITSFVQSNSAILNFLFLSLLIFTLFGVSINKVGLGYGNYVELGWIFLIFLVQDFLLIIIWRFSSIFSAHRKKALALVLSASMKNIAIAAGILLLYDPVAAVAPAIGFIAHAFLFTPWILTKIANLSVKTGSL